MPLLYIFLLGFIGLVFASQVYFITGIGGESEILIFSILWILQACGLLIAIFFSAKTSKNNWYVAPIVVHVLLLTANLYYFWSAEGWLFEYIGSDSRTYSSLAKDLSSTHITKWVDYMSHTKYDYQDYGMPFFKASIFWLGVNEFFSRLLNATFSILTMIIIYRSILISGQSPTVARIFSSFYLANPITIYFASSGLKEPLFSFLVSVYFYGILKRKDRKSRVLSFIALVSVIFFRLPTFIFLIFSYFFSTFLEIRTKTLRYIGIVGFSGASMIGALVNFEDISSNIHFVKNVSIGGMIEDGGLQAAAIFLSGLIGPFPAFDITGPDFSQSHYFLGNLTKMLLALFFFYGVSLSIRKRNSFMPMSVFCVITMASLMAVGVTLKTRYYMPIWPQFIIISSFGYSAYTLRSKTRYLRKNFIYTWVLLSALLTATWNFIV